MNHAIRRVPPAVLLGAVAACAVFAGPPAAAQASDASIAALVTRAVPGITRDEQHVARALRGYAAGRPSAPAVAALRGEARDLDALVRGLTRDPASSPRGAKGRGEIAHGLSLIATAYETLAGELAAAHGHAIPATRLRAAAETDAAGRRWYVSGLRLLAG